MAKEIFNDPGPPLSRLPGLLERLYDNLSDFLEAKLALFRKELWDEGESLARRTFQVAVGASVVWAGFLVVTAGLVLALEEWFHSPVWPAFMVGGIYILGGLIFVKLRMRDLRRPLPKTTAELEKDKRWIKANT